jgi:alcohol dehydrogenase YqhD (iron-dependent ADH family)
VESSPETLAADLKRFGRRILVLYGSSLPDGIRKTLTDAGEEFRLFEMSGAEPSPLDESVEVGASICRHERIDVLLAVGSDIVKQFAVRISETFRQRDSAGCGAEIVFVRIS